MHNNKHNFVGEPSSSRPSGALTELGVAIVAPP